MRRLSPVLALAALGAGGIDLRRGLGAARLGLGLTAALSRAGALAGRVAVRDFWHG
jgi:hypothetical protein